MLDLVALQQEFPELGDDHLALTETQKKVKQVIVLRKDLGMGLGKAIVQGAHASSLPYLNQATASATQLTIPLDEEMNAWLVGNFRKIAVGCADLEALIALYRQAKLAGLPCGIIKDNGLTAFKGIPTITAIAIGPAYNERIDPITGHLRPL